MHDHFCLARTAQKPRGKEAGNSVHAQEPSFALVVESRERRQWGVCLASPPPPVILSRPRWRRRAAEARGGLNLLLARSLPQLRRFCRVSSASGPASRSSQPPPEPARAQRRRRQGQPPERESAQPGGPRAPRSPPAGAGAPAAAAPQAAASASAPASSPPVTRPARSSRRPWPGRRETEAGEEGGSASPDRIWSSMLGPPKQGS